jgi:hypothetical protein
MRVPMNWCRSCGAGNNFGDQLGPRLLARAGIEAVWATPANSRIVTVGSILSKFTSEWAGTVWGTGYIQASMRGSFPRARVVSVRGELTRAHARLPTGTKLGDPGILAPDLIERSQLILPIPQLLVPHYVDHDMVARHPGVPAANVCGDPVEFLTTLASAELVFVSSLHALIAADALGVPHVWEPCGFVTGGEFKFNDYLSAFGETIKPGVERMTPRRAMLAKQREVREQLMSLRKMLE